MVGAVLMDLDGVLRHWPNDSGGVPGLAPELVRAALFEPQLLRQAVTGEISDEEWRTKAALALQAAHDEDCLAAMTEAAAYPGEVRVEVLDLVRRARRSVQVGLITNATTRLADHLCQLGLTDEFDIVFNSSDLGVAKPDAEIFQLACQRLALEPEAVMFVDDTPVHVEAACAVGLKGHLFTSALDLERLLTSAGIALSPGSQP